MFGYSSYLDKSMNGIKTITDGVAIIQNGDATFNTINVDTITSSNLTDCNLVNCTANDPQNSQDVVNKNYVDSNFVDKISNQSINGIKTFSVFPQTTATIPTLSNQLIRKDYADNNFMYKTNNVAESITGWKTFLNRVNLNGGTALVVETGTSSFGGTSSFNAQTTFYTVAPISNTEPTLSTHLTTKNYCDNTFVDKISNQSINGIKTFSVFPQTTATTPTLANELIRKDYVDNNFVDKSTSQIISGVKNFTNNTQFRGTTTHFDTQTPFSKLTESYQSGSIMINEQNFNLGSYQFKTRDSVGTLTSNLTIANTGISIFGKTTGGIFEGTTYNSTSATTDMAIGGTTTTGKILIGTVLNGSGELRLGTTLSVNNINGLTTFQKIPLVSGTPNITLNNELVTKLYVDSMPVHQILNTNNIWTGTNTYNTYLPTSTLTPTIGTQ
jgi:hypothetical protein